MPTGPNGEKRPADVVSNAVKIAKIAIGEITEDDDKDLTKDAAAQSLGKKGGKARAIALSKERREEIARIAAQARWKKNAD